jgi:hypothetical protein
MLFVVQTLGQFKGEEGTGYHYMCGLRQTNLEQAQENLEVQLFRIEKKT